MSDYDRQQMLLRAAFGFDTHDLEANRDGRLSPRQQQTAKVGQVSALPLLGMLFTGGMTLLILAAAANQSDGSGTAGLCYGLFFFGGITGIIAYSVFTQWTQGQQDLADQRVATISGLAQLVYDEKSTRLQIGRETFELPREKASALQPLARYCVYYFPRSRHILSVEMISHQSD